MMSPDQVAHLKDAPDPVAAQASLARRRLLEDITAHMIAYTLTVGFFALAFCSMIGFVALNEPVVAALVGSILGYAVGSLATALGRYYSPNKPALDNPTSEKK